MYLYTKIFYNANNDAKEKFRTWMGEARILIRAKFTKAVKTSKKLNSNIKIRKVIGMWLLKIVIYVKFVPHYLHYLWKPNVQNTSRPHKRKDPDEKLTFSYNAFFLL